MKHLYVLVLAGCLGIACADDSADIEGAVAAVFDGRQEPSGSRCPVGGVVLRSGEDDNGNGLLDTGEVRDVHLVCNLDDGIDAAPAVAKDKGKDNFLMLSRPQVAGATCAAGGVVFQWGADENKNGKLEAGEVDGTATLCGGVPGSVGAASLVNTTSEPAGARCADGGVKVETGVDSNGNSSLDADEVRSTSFVCHGQRGEKGVKGDKGDQGDPGTDGASTLIDTTDEPPGPQCPAGGVKVSVGVDANRDGVLSGGETSRISYVCNGVTVSGVDGGAIDTSADAEVDAGETLCSSDADNGICSVSIYDIKEGRVPIGTTVRLTDGAVTAVRVISPGFGFFMQVPLEAPGYRGPDHSGILVESATGLQSGDRIDVVGYVTVHMGQLRLVEEGMIIRGTGPVPGPIVVTTGEVMTGGPRAEALEAALVRIENVAVVSLSLPLGFTLEGGLDVDGFLFPAGLFIVAGTSFGSITGVLHFRLGTMRLAPRGSADLVVLP